MRGARLAVALMMGVAIGVATPAAKAGVITLGPALTTDASSGIGTGVAYTHRIGAGEAATINGVSFDLLNPTTTPAKFNWNTYPGRRTPSQTTTAAGCQPRAASRGRASSAC